MSRGLSRGNCPACGADMYKEAKAPEEGHGCLIALLGLVLVPGVIGIFILLYGLHLMTKREGYWCCPECGGRYPRRIAWYEFT